MPYYSRRDIKAKVGALLDGAGVRGLLPAPLEVLVAHLGYELVEFEPDCRLDAISGAVHHKKKRIYLNADESARRKVFTLAHEIGHIVLHGNRQDEFIDYRKDNNKRKANNKEEEQKEWEADNFASELLMPVEHFIQTWYKLDQIPWKVAPEYGVSERVAETRARILGLPVKNPFGESRIDEYF